MALRRIRLMSDYGVELPLWGDEGALGEGDVPLSAELSADLRAWQELFDWEFHYETGWRSFGPEQRYTHDAVDLYHRLRFELGDDVEIELDLWPVEDPRLVTWLEHRRP